MLGYSMQRQMSSSAHFLYGCTHFGGGATKKDCPHCGAVPESEEHALLWCPKHRAARRHLLRSTGWPRGEAQLEAGDAVRWMLPDAAHAQCNDEAMAMYKIFT